MPIENLPNGETQQWSATRSFVRNEGLAQVPVMADGDPVASEIVRLHAPVEHIVWNWVAVKYGGPPIAPSPNLLDTNNVLISSVIGSAVPTPHSAGGHKWTLAGTYTFAQQTPVGWNAPIPTGKVPWEKGYASDNLIPVTVFESGLLGSSEQPLNSPIRRP